MPIRPLRAALAAAALLTAFAGAAHAGQFRINVSNFVFSPRAVNLDMGDHAVWVWTGGTHTVTSGDSTGFMSGLFNSNSVDFGGAFSFRTSTPQLIRYYCIPHAPDMAGRLIVQASGNNNASDFRLTEVLFAGGEDRVEIANLGATGDLALYRLKISGQPLATLQLGSSNNLVVAASARIVLHFGVSGTNTATDLYFPTLSLPDAAGSVALYVPNTAAPALSDASQLIDFVQWGAGGQENEATANTAGVWTSGASINGVAPGHSVEFCGSPGQYGPASWSEVAVPNFGTNGGCATPTVRSTWGRIKTLYR